jgi:DNA-binding MarR family transcriptional regulator
LNQLTSKQLVKYVLLYSKAILTNLSSTDGGEPLEPRIVALLRLASEVGQTALYERLEAVGYKELRPAHFRLLRYPGIDGARPTELARRLGTSKQAINPLINDLERWGYLERRRDPSDQRGRLLFLTTRGRELMATIRKLHAEIEADWEQELGQRRYQTLHGALHHLAQRHPHSAQVRCGGRR